MARSLFCGRAPSAPFVLSSHRRDYSALVGLKFLSHPRYGDLQGEEIILHFSQLAPWPCSVALTRQAMFPYGCLFSCMSWWAWPIPLKPNVPDRQGSNLPAMASSLTATACSSLARSPAPAGPRVARHLSARRIDSGEYKKHACSRAPRPAQDAFPIRKFPDVMHQNCSFFICSPFWHIEDFVDKRLFTRLSSKYSGSDFLENMNKSILLYLSNK